MAQSSNETDTGRATAAKSASQQVVETVAEAEGVDPTELDPLYSVVDPDALDSLFHSQSAHSETRAPSTKVRFQYHGYDVRVTQANQITFVDLES